MTFIYDTGSAWIWFPTTACKACPNENLYDIDSVINLPQDPKERDKAIDKTQVEVLVYGTGEVGGVRIKEDVYIYPKGPQVVKNLVMLGIVVANGIEGDAADGILGLGPIDPNDGRGNFVTALKQQGIIDYEMFSFDFKPVGMKSKMIFGDIDREIAQNLSEFVWAPMEGEEDYWTLPLTGVYFGQEKTLHQAKYAVIDTGSSTLALSEDNFLELMQSVLDTGLDCGFFIGEKFVACICDNGFDDFPNFTLSIHGYSFDLSPEDYIAEEENICVILVYNLGSRVIIEQDTVVLGANFLRKYYTVFDMEKSRVGIYGNEISRTEPFFMQYALYALLIFLFLVLLCLIIWLINTRKVSPSDSSSQSGKMHGEEMG
ncbi:unnamed protein product [Moneuplotes crassus]|uniref:Peptidase A1 domain-containing protein n=1 Tax=Euplotes crassus TaxID=5936 RepID=A0AAD1UAL0_EUPCR|nr:unnamed protein product [Moneuplotes crassus]